MLSAREVRLALYCTGEEIRAREAGKAPGPARWLHDLVGALERELAESQVRQSITRFQEDLATVEVTEIGTGRAARMLGWNRQRVRRNFDQLGGRMVDGRLLFDATRISHLAEGNTADA